MMQYSKHWCFPMVMHATFKLSDSIFTASLQHPYSISLSPSRSVRNVLIEPKLPQNFGRRQQFMRPMPESSLNREDDEDTLHDVVRQMSLTRNQCLLDLKSTFRTIQNPTDFSRDIDQAFCWNGARKVFSMFDTENHSRHPSTIR